MKRNRIMKIFLITPAILVCVVIVLFAMTYPICRREMNLARVRLSAGSSILKTDHGDIEYAVEGVGKPVLVLHGAGGGYDQGLWAGKVTLGTSGYRFISVSRFGYLRSTVPPKPSIQKQAALYGDLLNYLHIDRVIVLGASAGGPSATQFANDYPDRCAALILVSAVSMAQAPGDKPPFYIGIIHLIQQSDYAYWIFAKFMRPVILSLMGVPARVLGHLTPEQRTLSQEMLDIMHPMSRRYAGTINDGTMIEADGVSAGAISAPTLIMHARDDALVSYLHAENAHRRIKQSKLILFETGGHGMLSRTNEIRGHVKDFLKGTPNSSSGEERGLALPS